MMMKSRAVLTPGKPIASVLVTLLWVIAFVVVPSWSFHIPNDAVNYALSFNIKWIAIIALAVAWLMFQLFWRSSSETTKLSLGVSYTLLWLALAFFFPFKDPAMASVSGAAAFFTLAGGLGVVLIWVRFLADDI